MVLTWIMCSQCWQEKLFFFIICLPSRGIELYFYIESLGLYKPAASSLSRKWNMMCHIQNEHGNTIVRKNIALLFSFFFLYVQALRNSSCHIYINNSTLGLKCSMSWLTSLPMILCYECNELGHYMTQHCGNVNHTIARGVNPYTLRTYQRGTAKCGPTTLRKHIWGFSHDQQPCP